MQGFAEYTVSQLDTYLFGMYLICSVTPKSGILVCLILKSLRIKTNNKKQ